NQFSGESRKAIELSLRPHLLNDNALSLHVPEIAQSLTERVDTARDNGSRPAAQESYPRDLSRLLRLGRKRRKKNAEKKNNREPDPPHEHLVTMAGGSLADESCSQELATLVEHGSMT